MHLIGEVVKQFESHVPMLPQAIKGKIVKYTSEDEKDQYNWSISHHYHGYFPSRVTSSSLEEAEGLFRIYAGNFIPDEVGLTRDSNPLIALLRAIA